jgi:hypothetical protein
MFAHICQFCKPTVQCKVRVSKISKIQNSEETEEILIFTQKIDSDFQKNQKLRINMLRK